MRKPGQLVTGLRGTTGTRQAGPPASGSGLTQLEVSARRHPGGLSPSLPLGYPQRNQGLVGSGLPAQVRGASGDRLVQFAVRRSLEDSCHLGQQVTASRGERAELGERDRFFLSGERAPLRVMPCLAGDLGDEQAVTVSCWEVLAHLARIEHGYAKDKMNSRNATRLHPVGAEISAPGVSVPDMDTALILHAARQAAARQAAAPLASPPGS